MPPRDPTWQSQYSHLQSAAYLQSLRTNRPARPTGSRPAPFRTNHLIRSDSAPIIDHQHGQTADTENDRPQHPGIPRSTTFNSTLNSKGRPLATAPDPVPSICGRKVSPTATVQRANTTPVEYLESTTRRLEKEEAHTLREALDVIDKKDEEHRIYEAAQSEAADLVWKHRNPQAAEDEKIAPYINPDIRKQKDHRLKFGKALPNTTRNVSDSSTSSNGTASTSRRSSKIKDRKLSNALNELQLASEGRSADIVSVAKDRRRSSGKRLVSSGSNKSLFRNPEDQIYEEPESVVKTTAAVEPEPAPLKARPRNSLPRDMKVTSGKPAITPKRLPWINRVEIQRNPPSQSRDAAYTANTPTPPPKEETIEEVGTLRSMGGLEVRGDDIRAATSMMKKDRSPKLPTPVAVSDQVGRPIVSFDPNWRPPADSPRNSHDMTRPVIKLTESPRTSRDMIRPLPRPLPSVSEPINSAPVVPTIMLPEDEPTPSVPTFNVPEDQSNVPTINISNDTTPAISVSAPAIEVNDVPAPRKLPTRPLPVHASTAPIPTTKAARLPWLNGPRSSGPTVSCTACFQPISGRIVTAAGSKAESASSKARFHPACFRCAHCSTSLEAVAFFPEPENAREERINNSDQPEVEEADFRFYCHLDFHELYSPRCRSCKTPIEGAVISACGHTYHEEHFFCAECGDPFSNQTPFVEHNGYAYCVTCHTRRTSARCRGCKQVILEELTVEALGGKWHEQCFVCYECAGDFGNDGRFFIRDIDVEPTAKERRQGITRKQEERAVCQGCEEIRLKA